jgi:hypothetical protein
MDIRDLFKFKCSFKGYRKQVASSEVKCVMGILKNFSQVKGFLIYCESLFDFVEATPISGPAWV